jgi:hypothetical protein
MNNLLVAIAVFVITVVGALFTIPYFVDWNSYRRVFEEEASRVIGREVQVDGDVKLHLLPIPTFRIEKVRIADTASASLTEPFFKAESLSVKLSIPPMFRGIVEANEIEFQQPVLRVAMDANGRWNWQSFAHALGVAAYMPSNVTLTSLNISNGILALHGPDGTERTRLEGLNGVLSAPELTGPYRFRGSFFTGGAEREIRVATAAPEGNGSVRFRASLRLADSEATYLLDARLLDLMGKPRVDGELTARIPVAGLWEARKPDAPQRRKATPAVSDEEHKLDTADAAFDLKAGLAADIDGATLSDLTLSFEHGGRPQLITGKVQAAWRNAVALDMRLASRWLDLDRITTAVAGEGPLASIAKIAAGMRDILPGYPSRVAFSIDQANLGGEAVGAVQLSLVRSAGATQLEYLRAGLPGNSHGVLKGAITGSAETLAFTGSVSLRGTSPSRFVAWVTGSAAGDARSDGPFSIKSRLAVTSGRVEAKDLVGTLSGTMLKGAAHYEWKGRPQVSVALEGPQLDARALVPVGSDFPGILALLTDSRPPPDMSLALRTGLLLTAGHSYRDVVARMELEGGHLKQVLVRLSSDEGYSLEMSGRVNDALSQPKGTLRGWMSAQSASGVAAAMDLLGLPKAVRVDDARAQAMVPLRLAGTLSFAGRTAASTDLLADGSANGMPIKLSARLDGGPGEWKTKGVDVTISLDAPEPAKMTALLLPGVGSNADRVGGGRLLIKATGIPAQGLASIVTVTAPGDLNAEFRGQLNVTEPGLKAVGDLEVRAADGTELAAFVGPTLPVRMDGLPVSARLKLTLDDAKLGMRDIAAQIGDAKIAGQLTLSTMADRRRIDAALYADEVSLAQLMAPLLDQRLAVAGMAEAAVSGRQGLWPDVPFDGSVLDALEGQVELNCNRLVIGDGIALDGASLKIGLSAGKVEVQELTGATLGGQVAAKLTLGKIAAGAEVKGKLTMTAALDSWPGAGSSAPGGSMRANIEFGGRGTSPRAIIAALQGKGSIDLKDTKLAALWPGAVALAADAGLKAEPDKLSAIVRQTIATGLGSGVVPMGPRPISLEIGDGQLRAKPFVIETGDGRASGSASLDLMSLDFHSQWRLEARAVAAGSSARRLPVVAVEYAGPVSSLGTLTPRIDSAALEQEISARKIERDVEELERLRKLDEQRRAMETERLRHQFEQTPPVQRPLLPPGVPVAPSGREARPAAPG